MMRAPRRQEADHCVQTGQPLMRALALAYPGDPACRQYPYQYLFGRHLLVAPVVEPDASTWTVYLPEGDWVDFWTRESVKGGQAIRRTVPLSEIPVYVRKGASIPLYLPEGQRLGDPVGNGVHRAAITHFRADE